MSSLDLRCQPSVDINSELTQVTTGGGPTGDRPHVTLSGCARPGPMGRSPELFSGPKSLKSEASRLIYTTKWEWLVNQHRDSYCSYMGHFDLLNYFSIAENESKARVRFNLMEKMLQPCGPPADKPDDA
ncbi:hypothetical protein Q7C36_007617 [Tachysurus vachellii]|uniref:Splicing factor 3B subunit 5 n=1 Tax=Tachysurus vachellii TaxID=175792 RepID=A0AA88N902_TACVA|nr:hypothetical protein Q7C36_007617 [Tachysurus vachellii]